VGINEELARRIVRRLEPPCPFCGEEGEWLTFGSALSLEPTKIVLGATWPNGKPVEERGFTVTAQVCSNCRFVRLTAADPTE
jgi:hypothetical protein